MQVLSTLISRTGKESKWGCLGKGEKVWQQGRRERLNLTGKGQGKSKEVKENQMWLLSQLGHDLRIVV